MSSSPAKRVEQTRQQQDDGEEDHYRGAGAEMKEAPNFLVILPVLFLEFLAIAVTKSLLPERLNAFFGDRVYYAIGVAETVKGLLAFCACPLFGRVSDVVGRANCLLVTVLGTTAPCWILALTENLWVYVTCLALSGIFAGTFTLVFAYISDVVAPSQRAPAYGLALATLGFSFTIGPPLGAFAADAVGEQRVYLLSLVLALLDAGFIAFCLPESNVRAVKLKGALLPRGAFDPLDTLKLFRGDPLLRQVASIVLLYYSGVWALVTTIVIYVVRVFDMSKVEVGWILSSYGLATMISEGLLVGRIVPRIGEVATFRIGLVAFAGQCVLIAVARTPRLIYASISLSLLSNLVYPAISSLVSRSVSLDEVGEALGAINGVKAVTEGAGPLAFATLMANFEHTSLPGLPYLANAILALLALAASFQLPSEEEYAHFKDYRQEEDLELVGLLAHAANLDDDDDNMSSNNNEDAIEIKQKSQRRDPPSTARSTVPPRQPNFQAPLTTAKAAFSLASSPSSPIPAPRKKKKDPPRRRQ